ncbi:MAG: dihydropteroate synthase [Alphaproteobacteria bacterium]|nr:dihydropteroate synthase [Alphaproteobacteria bacterium]
MIDFLNPQSGEPILMGVVNVTPDSFSDGGEFIDPNKAIKHALQLAEDGAHILDIGGESTRPGAKAVTPEEEQGRVLPVIKGIRDAGSSTLISIDTRHADTMQKAINTGADIINDISALTHDVQSLSVVSKAQVPVMLMHMQGSPETMQDRPEYDNVVDEVYAYLEERVSACVDAGIEKKNIVIDPGIGFGKTLEDNLKILKNIDKFHNLGCAVLLGTSRKSFIEKICSGTPEDKRLAGSLASILHGYEKGVQLFRVHDVAETRQAFDIWRAIEHA